MNKSKVVIYFLLPSLRGGGAERMTLNLLKGLNRKELQLKIILGEKVGPFIDKIPMDVSIINLKVHHMRDAFLKLVRHLHQERPDILFSVMGHTNVIALLAKRVANVSTKILVSVHSTPSKVKKNRLDIRARLVPYFERWLYPKADKVIAVSQGVKNDISEYLGINKEKIAMIYNPIIDEEIFELAQEPVNHPWFHNSKIPIILAVGALKKQKNYPLLFKAFKLICRKLPLRLVILGEGGERENLENLSQELKIADKIDLQGFQRNPYKFIAKASVFALSSSLEGLPTVLVEAMACGVPVVSTNCPSGPREIITEPGYNGLLVQTGNPKALAEAIFQVLDNKDLAMRLSKGGLERVKYFDAKKITKEYEELFKSLLLKD